MSLTCTGSNDYIQDTASGFSLNMRDLTVLAWTRGGNQVNSSQNRIWVLSDDLTIGVMPNILSVATTNSDSVQTQFRDSTTNQIWSTSNLNKTDLEPLILRVRPSTDAFDLRQNQTDLYTNQAITPSLSGKTVDQFCVGGRSGTASQDYTGDIGFCAIWQSWLSDQDVQALSDGAHPLMISPSTLKSMFQFDKATGLDLMQAFVNMGSPVNTPSIDASDNPPLFFPE